MALLTLIGCSGDVPPDKTARSPELEMMLDENTQFKLTGNHICWWTPGDWDIYEHLFNTTRFLDIDALSKKGHESLAQTYIPENAIRIDCCNPAVLTAG